MNTTTPELKRIAGMELGSPSGGSLYTDRQRQTSRFAGDGLRHSGSQGYCPQPQPFLKQRTGEFVLLTPLQFINIHNPLIPK